MSKRYDRLRERRWRHLPWGRNEVALRYAPWRVECGKCGRVGVEQVPWARHKSRFTLDFEELVAYLAKHADKTRICELVAISWRTVGSIITRVVTERADPGLLDGLRRLGVDELSFRKRHRYVTVVVDHDRRRVVWAAEGRSSETLNTFFAELGEERCAQIELVTIDMAAGYIKAIRETLPHAEIVFDRFHVQRLAADAVDEVRRAVVRELAGTEQARTVKHLRWPLLRDGWNLQQEDQQRICDLQRTNRGLFRAYLLKEGLVEIFSEIDSGRAETCLREWMAWASRSRLEPFVKAARTIRRHLPGVLAYFKTRLTNGLVEGLNNKTRLIARRAFGFHSAKALISMIRLCCSNIALDPPLPRSGTS